MLKIRLFLSFLLAAVFTVTQAQTDNGMLRMDDFRRPKKRQVIQIPDYNGFKTLKCDFHIHTVFSDGHVWPNVRIQEAWNEGLDVIAITDHVEYHPYSEYVVVDHDKPYDLVKEVAAENNIVLIKGTEITRQTPPGHFNAIFTGELSGYIEDRETNEKDKQAVMKAVEQNAFIFWNHPGWKVDQIEGSYEWIDFVDDLYKEKNLHGIEVFNGFGFHKKALDWCVDNDLTVMGSSDIHNLVVHDYDLDDIVHRSMTLVFAKERTPGSVREALEAGRTVAWASKYIAGREEHVRDLFDACVEVGESYYSKGDRVYYEITNNSDLYFELKLKSGNATGSITLYPRSSQIINARSGQGKLVYEVINTFIRSDEHLVVELHLN